MPIPCPDCQTELADKAFSGVHVHPCPNCGGVWFDHGKLEELRSSHAQNLEDLDEGVHGRVEPSTHQHNLSCPDCKGALSPYSYALNAKIEMDVCHDCRGIWVRHEGIAMLAYSIKASRPDLPPAPVNYPSSTMVVQPPAPRPIRPGYGYDTRYEGGYDYDYMDGAYFRQSVAADIATVAVFTALDFLL